MKKISITPSVYWFLIIVPGSILFVLFKKFISPEVHPHFHTIFFICFYIPFITFLRMKHMGMSTKEMLISLIPFYGSKLKSQGRFGKK